MATKTTLDAKGRVSIPRELRERCGLEAGAVFFIEERNGDLVFRQAENPFDVLAMHAIEEYRAGRTVDFFDFVKRQESEPDDE